MCSHLLILPGKVGAAQLLLPGLAGAAPHPHAGEEAGDAVHRGAAGDATVLESAAVEPEIVVPVKRSYFQ